MKMRWERTGLLVGMLAMLAPGLRADDVTPTALTVKEAASTDEAFDFFLKEAEVVTASRRAQKKSDSPVAIDVITREEIAQSGALNIWDLLRFRVGLDVSEGNSIEGNPVQLNVRGLPEEFNQALLVLIDGRSVVSPLNSGVFWRNLPIALEDIERIEIVRGPNSALFGANAGHGVINIISKKPEGSGGEFHSEAGQFGYLRSHLGLSLGEGRAKVRASLTDRTISTFPNTQGNTDRDLTGQKDSRLNARASVQAWEDGEVELFAGGVQTAFSEPGVLGVNGGTYDEQYLMAQLRQKLGDHSLELMLARKQDNVSYGSALITEQVYDADLLGRLSLLDGKALTTLGGSFRHMHAASRFIFDRQGAAQGSRQDGAVENKMKRAYLSETLSPADWVTMVLAGSYEGSDTGGDWPAYQGALILKPWEGHSLRLSGSKSPTMPSLQNKYQDVIIPVATGFPVGAPPGPWLLPALFVRGADITPSQVASYEATWSSTFLERKLTAEITGFQMEIAGQPSIRATNAPNEFIPGQYSAPWAYVYVGSPLATANTFNIVLRGTETVLTYKPRLGTTLQLNHTYEDQYTDNSDPTRDFITPWNKVNFLANSELLWGFNAGARVGWVGRHRAYIGSRFASAWIEDQAKVDLRLGYKPAKDIEVYVMGVNLDHAIRTENVDGATQPQMYFGGVNLAWGGN